MHVAVLVEFIVKRFATKKKKYDPRVKINYGTVS